MLDTDLVNKIGVPGLLVYLVLRDVVPRIVAKWRKDGSSVKVQGIDKDLAVLEQRTTEIEEKLDEHHRALIDSLSLHTADDVRRFDAVHQLLVDEGKARREDIQDVRDIQVRQLERLGRIDAHLEHLLVSRPRRSES